PVLPMEWYGKEYVLPEMSFDSGQRVIRVMGLKYDDQVWYFVDVNITTGTATKVFQIEAFLENL
ncbi:hypothetical protein Bpfe_002605, partial [Biomphalaria pfeifferi]